MFIRIILHGDNIEVHKSDVLLYRFSKSSVILSRGSKASVEVCRHRNAYKC